MGMVAEALKRRAEARTSVMPGVHPSRLDDPGRIFGTGYIDDATGLNLSESEVIGAPAVLQAMRMISWSIAQMPCHLYERKNGKLEAAKDHPLYWILHHEPHPEYTPFEFNSAVPFNAAFRGDFFGQINRDYGEQIKSILPLKTFAMQVDRERGNLVYKYQQSDGSTRRFKADQILHVRGMCDGGFLGMALQQLAPTSLAKSVAMDRFGARVFKNGMNAGAVVETDDIAKPHKWNSESDKQAFFDALSDAVSGEKNWHKVIGLPAGMHLKTLGVSAAESQLIEGMTFQVQDIARLTGVPPSLLMELSRATFTNSEQQMLQFIQLTLGGWIVNIEQRYQKSLLTMAERHRYSIKFLVDGLLRTDLKTQNEALRVAVGRPWMSVNEARDLKELAPVEGEDKIAQPLNMGNPGGDPDQSTDTGTAPTQDGDADTRSISPGCHCGSRSCSEGGGVSPAVALATPKNEARMMELRDKTRERRALRGAFQRQFKRDAGRLMSGVIREVRKLAEKHIHPTIARSETRDTGDFVAATAAYFEDEKGFPAAVRKIMGPLFESYAEAVAEAVAREQGGDVPSVAEFLDRYTKGFTSSRGGSLNGQIRKIAEEIGDGDLFESLEDRLDEWENGREDGKRASQAEKISGIEVVYLGDGVARMAFAALGVTSLVWMANSGACPLCEELDGQTVGIEREFVEQSGQVEGDDDTPTLTARSNINHPPLHSGCDCTIAAE